MYRIIITLAAVLMLCGTTLAKETKDVAKDNGSKTPVASSASETVQAKKPIDKVKVKRQRIVHRLPNHFKAVVTEEQKAKIYKIQDEYAPTIAEYRAKLAKALKERNAKINAILTSEQMEKVKQLRKDAKEKRKDKAEKETEEKEEK